MIIESAKRTYNRKGSAIPVWKLDTDSYTVYHYDEEKSLEDITSFHSECIRCHIDYVCENAPERLESLVNSGMILSYLEDLEDRINKEFDKQTAVWKSTDKEYLLAAANDNNILKSQLANNFDLKAKEVIYAAMVYA